ncbi:MAG: 50S ribosomal protein L32 [Victivallales bacterium]|nr:50S ribosomal protein L32 [Victivallales bacterium]MCF7888892.1 50S ribosomal protein L32 [Victivallales bacterium]
MAVPRCKKSKSKKRHRKAAGRYEGIESGVCPVCNEPVLPHRVCKSCGNYKDKQVITVEE